MLKIRRKFVGLTFIAALISSKICFSQESKDQLQSPVLYEAADLLVGYFAADFAALTEKTKKTAIVNFSISENLPASLKSYLVKKIESAAKDYKQGPLVIVQCVECLSLQALSKGDEVFISKGITDKQQLDAVKNRLAIRNYLDAHLTFTGSELVLQLSLIEADQQVSWSGEYRSYFRHQDVSPWILGLTGQGTFFMKDRFPTPKSGRLFVGQKIYGLGNIGLAATMHQKSSSLAAINEVTAFFELNQNEFFSTYWKHLTLLYSVDLGVADFNSYLQLAFELGVRLRIGRYFHVRLAGKAYSHIAKPDNDNAVFNPNGKPIISNNESLPPAVLFGLGFDIL